jgi:hypothetical protein
MNSKFYKYVVKDDPRAHKKPWDFWLLKILAAAIFFSILIALVSC